MGYQEDLKIDKFVLDVEWLNQPLLFAKYAEEAVNAAFERDKCKEQLDLTRAELDGKIRSDPSKFGLDKITESAITNIILQHDNYKEANQKYIKYIKITKTFEVAREAFEHRKKALERLTDLYIGGYWSEPRIKGDTKEQFQSEVKGEQIQKLNENPRLRKRRE